MLAYVFSFDSDYFNLIVLDQDRTDLSRRYIAELTSDNTFRVVLHAEHYEEIDAWLQAGRAHLALVIPLAWKLPCKRAILRLFRRSWMAWM